MKALFYDSETSGLPLFNEPSDDPRQPHIVQLGARLVNLETRKIIATLDVIIRPEGWTIPEEVSNVHGITNEIAADVGVSELVATHLLMELWNSSQVRIGHNEPFDARIMRIALKRYADEVLPDPDDWKAGAAECTARMATPIMNLPPTAKMVAAGRNHPKTPNLREAFKFFTGNELDGAHSALVDVDACMACYFAMKDRETAAA